MCYIHFFPELFESVSDMCPFTPKYFCVFLKTSGLFLTNVQRAESSLIGLLHIPHYN